MLKAVSTTLTGRSVSVFRTDYEERCAYVTHTHTFVFIRNLCIAGFIFRFGNAFQRSQLLLQSIDQIHDCLRLIDLSLLSELLHL